jgi:hypothetical protein
MKDMRKFNILNKEGLLSDEDRKEPLEHVGHYVNFQTNLDLTQPVKVTPWGNTDKITVNQYSQDLASFMVLWKHFVMEDLNGFPGFSHVKFELVGFKIV